MSLNGTQRLVCLYVCVRIYVPRGVPRDLMLRSRMGRKSRSQATSLPPPLHNSCVWLLSGGFQKKKSLLLYFIVKNAEFFHQPNLTSAKDLTINVSEAVTFREREQCERWRCAMGNELNFLFCFSIVYFQLNEQCESLCVCVFVWDQISYCFPAEHRSYLNLQNALVASRCNGGRLKLLKLGIFHIK